MNPRPDSAGGFPEWPPGLRAVEARWLDRVRRVFESHGFGPVATSSLEPPGEEPGEALAVGDGDLALCADLTASFLRWAADHRDELDLPFRGRQAQRVWRGSREDGVRESTWCALGVVDAAPLSPRLDAELPRVAHEALSGLDLPAWTLGVGNRRVLAGFSVVGPDHCAGTVYGGRVAPGAGSAGPWSGGVCSGGRYAGRAGPVRCRPGRRPGPLGPRGGNPARPTRRPGPSRR
ncbi:hypothetical protein [Saccharothrix lopnurensis]|uniref:Uncharacterized protein n=1 Tax=Saccharothrix lopnurensis TaxID=1670621 RepID=A0ABW1PFQ5_9PSEU